MGHPNLLSKIWLMKNKMEVQKVDGYVCPSDSDMKSLSITIYLSRPARARAMGSMSSRATVHAEDRCVFTVNVAVE